MSEHKYFKVLKSLPPYGPVYIPIYHYDDNPYSEGYVIEFTKKTGEKWIANFQVSFSKLYAVFDWPDRRRLFVIAGGLGYIMSPDSEKIISLFGNNIQEALQNEEGSLICHDGIQFFILDNANGEFWQSERISWDGIKDLNFKGTLVTGKSFDPTNSTQEWSEFSIDIKTKKISGGSFQEFLENNTHLEVGSNGIVKEKQNTSKKPWWKFW
ncbi:hypothetical protein [Owenweeksia hongkongensis]|uniref:hypothetical protein n=1 Tax=Owenweeksia hongkongensis TaxID=253245 RepID=UPI003A8CF8B8